MSANDNPRDDYPDARPFSQQKEKDLPTYKFEEIDKSLMIIISHRTFTATNVEDRSTTDHDVNTLKETFSGLRFDIEDQDYKDLNKDEIVNNLQKLKSKPNLNTYACVSLVVLSRGCRNGMIWAKDSLYDASVLVDALMHLDTMVAKPKLIFISAHCDDEDESDDHNEDDPYYLPVGCDMFIFYSRYDGRYSSLSGCWFIETICMKINAMAAEYEITDIAQELLISYDRHVLQHKTTSYKNAPVFISTLIKTMYFKIGAKPREFMAKYAECLSRRRKELAERDGPDQRPTAKACVALRGYISHIKRHLRRHLDNYNDDEGEQYWKQINKKDNLSTEDVTKIFTLLTKKEENHDIFMPCQFEI